MVAASETEGLQMKGSYRPHTDTKASRLFCQGELEGASQLSGSCPLRRGPFHRAPAGPLSTLVPSVSGWADSLRAEVTHRAPGQVKSRLPGELGGAEGTACFHNHPLQGCVREDCLQVVKAAGRQARLQCGGSAPTVSSC